MQMEANQKQKFLVRLDQKEKNYDQEKKTRAETLEKIRKEKEEREKTIQGLTLSAHDLQNKVAQILKEEAKVPKRRKVTKHIQATKSAPATVVTTLEVVPEGKGLQVIRGRVPWPVSGRIISYFGKSKDAQFHPTGSPIHAVSGGVVKFADWFKGYGKLVILDHGKGYYSLYAQASELKVSEGDSVVPGQVLGLVGDTDSLVGSSLYFEIRKNGVPQDPLRWLKYRN
jgi:septal ring factor EnvC (AmiA/AmiB activator)